MIKLKQGEFIENLKVVGELITNKIISLDSYLKIVSVDGVQYLTGFGSQHDLIIKLSENDLEDFSVNVEYSKLVSLVSYMKEDITIEIDNNGLLAKDGTVKTFLNNLMVDNTDVEDVKEILGTASKLAKKGIKVKRKEFHDTLKYLRGVQERDERTDIETGIMFTKDYSYVVSNLYAVRHKFGIDEDLIVDGHTTRVLNSLLTITEDEEFIISRKDGVTFFLVEDSVYRVDGLLDEILDSYIEIFNHRDTTDKITMEKDECLRVLHLTKVFTDTMEPDITFEIKKGKGRIYTETQDGEKVDSKFKAESCSDMVFTVSVDEMIAVIGKLPKGVADKLMFDVVNVPEEYKYVEPDLLHLHYELGDCVFSINTDV